MTQASTELLIGAHTSTAGGLYRALLEGEQIGATAIQLFTANQRRWQSKPLEALAIELWQATLAQTAISQIMSHSSYLINLGSADPQILAKSQKAFAEEIARCHQLQITFLNFHPGVAKESSEQQCLDTIVASLLALEGVVSKGKTRLLLETTAGQGSVVGDRFEHLAYIIDRLHHRLPIGVCIDTCHIFAAGYDLRTIEACNHTLNTFDRLVGLKHLYAFHLNDSQKPFGSHVDRHASLANGHIGLEAFRFLMCDSRTRHIPKYLETPEGPAKWQEEICLLRQMAKGAIEPFRQHGENDAP